MDHLQRLRYVTERYEQLQGLRLVPLGIPFLLSAAWRDGRLTWVPGTQGMGAHMWFLALFSAALTLSLIAKRYYRLHFGNVHAAMGVKAPLAVFVFAGLFIVAASLQEDLRSPVSIPAVIIALGLGYLSVVGGQLRPHYLTVAVSMAVFAVLGLFGVPLHARSVLLDQLTGLGFIVSGIGDHLMLRNTLVPVPHV
jgi:hypothetical protein